MLNKNEIFEIIESIDKKELALEMVEESLNFRGISGVVFAEMDIETGDVKVNFRADYEFKPEKEEGLWIAKFTTENMDEIPDDLEDKIENAEDSVAEFYRTYPEHGVEFFEEYKLEEKMKELGVNKIKLIKRKNQYSRDEYEYEVLEKEVIEDILDNLDSTEVARELLEKAFEYEGISGRAIAELDIQTGEISYYFLKSHNFNLEPDLYIALMSFDKVQTMFDLSDDYVLDNEEMDELKELMDEDIHGEDAMDYGEAYDAIIEKYNINAGERLRDYYLEYVACEMDFDDDLKERLEDIYISH